MPSETGIIIALRRRSPIEVAGQRVHDLGIAAEVASAAADGFAARFRDYALDKARLGT